MTISPAYGKDYKSGKEAIEAFQAGKDFRIESGPYTGRYCSKRDLPKGTEVTIRFKRLQECVLVTV